MAGLNVDVFTLIELVRERPAIWDRKSDLYKDRRHTKLAWREVCSSLVPEYETYSENEQFEIGKHLLSKWTNLRDNFIKSNKKIRQSLQSSLGINRNKHRKYIFYDQLRFLEKVLDDKARLDLPPLSPSQEETSLGTTPRSANLPTTSMHDTTSDWESNDTRMVPNKKRKLINNSNSNTNSTPTTNLVENILEIMENHQEPDPDQSFFNSILPLVQNFCEDEKLEFRMEVLKLIKSMKASRRRL